MILTLKTLKTKKFLSKSTDMNDGNNEQTRNMNSILRNFKETSSWMVQITKSYAKLVWTFVNDLIKTRNFGLLWFGFGIALVCFGITLVWLWLCFGYLLIWGYNLTQRSLSHNDWARLRISHFSFTRLLTLLFTIENICSNCYNYEIYTLE